MPLKAERDPQRTNESASSREPDSETDFERTLFRREIDTYLSCFGRGLGIGQFTDINASGQEDPNARRYYFSILKLQPREPRAATWVEIAGRLQRIYDAEVKRFTDLAHSVHRTRELHDRLLKSQVTFLLWKNDGHSGLKLVIGQRELRLLYRRSRFLERSVSSQATPQRVLWRITNALCREQGAHASADIDVVSANLNISASEVVALMKELLALLPENERNEAVTSLGDALGLYRISEGCTTLRIEVPREAAQYLVARFGAATLDGDLRDKILMIRLAKTHGRTIFDPPRPARPRDDATAERTFAKLWRQVILREAAVAPWRRLRWLLSPTVISSPLSHVIAESDRRAYATTGLLQNGAALRFDLSMAWLTWPAMTGVLLAATLMVIRHLMPDVAVSDGLITGLALALAGGQVCAFVVAPIAVGAGAIFMAWAFGVAQGVIIGPLGGAGVLAREALENDFFLTATGGLLGLTAPQWLGRIPLILIVAMLMAIAVAIAASGWLMSQPMNARGASSPKWPDGGLIPWRTICAVIPGARLNQVFAGLGRGGIEIVGGLIGASVGGCIGITFGLYSLLILLGVPLVSAFSLGFGIVGGSLFAVIISMSRKRKPAVAGCYGAGYFIFVLALCQAVEFADSTLRIVLLSALTAVFQATWFTGAFIVGSRFSSRSAVIATSLEGALGFTTFIVSRVLHG